jgi:phospholipid/cholesterol/gamma-HCH transport system substrate-binding protein
MTRRRFSFSRPRSRTAVLLGGLLSSALVLSGCSIYDAPLPGGPDTGKNPVKVTLMFRDVLDLVPQSTVKVDDVTVGKVTKIDLKGYVAKVTIALPRKVDLPDNATAQIRQTSLLGEKFVDLEQPRSPSSKKLSNGDVIGLDRTGRNPEVEEVFGALALLLNGGGVGQLKTIASELNNAFSGRESDVRSVLDQIREFTTTLDQNKSSVVQALENTNRLAVALRKQDKTIKATLDDVPSALASINRQRDDLVKLLKSLTRLSGVGVRVIQASKESTINSLRDLAPVLSGFAQAGQNFPKSFQVFLTYPFVDEAVGRDPQVARNLHMGDYTNLSVKLDLNLDLLKGLLPTLPGLPSQVCAALDQVLQTTRTRVNAAAQQIVDSLPANPLITAQEKQALKNAIINGSGSQAGILDTAIQQATAQCKAPSPQSLLDAGSAIVANLISILGILTAGQLTQLLNGTLGTVTGTLGTVLSGVPGSSGLGNSGTVGGGGGILGGGNGLVPRAQLGKGYQAPTPIDPFGLEAKGYDPGVGTILFQGVATQK